MTLSATNPFLGSEAVAAGVIRKHELRSRFRAVYPGVYLPRHVKADFRQRAEAAWLWSHRQGVLSGLTAARIHGAMWVDDASPIELTWSNGRPPDGLLVARAELDPAERELRSNLPVTSLSRTAFDIGRRGRLVEAVARLDALGNAARLTAEEVLDIADRHPGARGVRRLRRALDLYDPGAQSPRETWLRLVVMEGGFRRPQTQIPVRGPSGRRYYLDMGWEDLRIAVEYDGDHHRSDKRTFGNDIVRLEELASLGWIVIRIVAGTPRREVIRRVRAAWDVRTSSSVR